MLKYVARASLIMLPCLLWAGTDISGSRSGCWYAAQEVSNSHLLKNSSFSLAQLWYTMQSRYPGETAHAMVIPGSRGLIHFLHIILVCSWLTQNKNRADRVLESKLPLQSRACIGGGQGSQPAPTKPQPQPGPCSTWKGENLSFSSGPSFVHPPGHARCALRSPQQEILGVPILDRPWEALSPSGGKCSCTLHGWAQLLQQAFPFIFPTESENRKLPSGFSSSVDTSRLTDPLPLGEQAFRNKLFQHKFHKHTHMLDFILLPVWFSSTFSKICRKPGWSAKIHLSMLSGGAGHLTTQLTSRRSLCTYKNANSDICCWKYGY